MPVRIANKICYATVGNMSLSGSCVTLRLMSQKDDAEAIYSSFVNGAFTIRVGQAAAGYDSFLVNGWFQRDRSGVQMQAAYAEITLVFDTQSVLGLTLTTGSSDRYDPVYDMSTNTEERPIEQHPNFKCSWTYNLYQLVPLGGSASAVPAWAATDTNPAAIHAGYLWAHTPPSSPDPAKEYVQVQAATDFGMDSYLIPRQTVTSIIYYKRRQVQNSDLVNVARLKAPGDTFHLPDTQTCWLVTGSQVGDASDDLRAVTTTYTYCEEGWKTKVYPLAT